jgi:archaellum component FlaD/FlaE
MDVRTASEKRGRSASRGSNASADRKPLEVSEDDEQMPEVPDEKQQQRKKQQQLANEGVARIRAQKAKGRQQAEANRVAREKADELALAEGMKQAAAERVAMAEAAKLAATDGDNPPTLNTIPPQAAMAGYLGETQEEETTTMATPAPTDLANQMVGIESAAVSASPGHDGTS